MLKIRGITMPNGKIDGHFVVNTNLETSIRNELGLSEVECKEMGCVWEQVLNEANNISNFEVANKNQESNQQNNLSIQVGTVIKFTKECWTRIVDMVNNALKSFSDKQIQADVADEYHDNVNLGEYAIQQFNEENPKAESSTYYAGLAEYLIRYGNDRKKLEECKLNPQFTDFAKYIEDYQVGKISIEELQQKATELDNGNGINIRCGQRAQMLQNRFAQQGIRSEVIGLAEIDNIEIREDDDGKYLFMPRPEHAFCVIGLDENADTTNPATWGKNAVIVDAWLGKTFSVEEGINYYKEFFRYNDDKDETGNVKEYKMSFGTQQQIWDKLPQLE